MNGKRIGFILILIGIFVLGVFQVNRLLNSETGGSRGGDSATIRGRVETLLPSGKVIVVRRDDGSEVLLSLSEAYTITDELGEDLFYTDVKPGMAITAAGIRGVEDNVVIPSLVTVNLAYAGKGVLTNRLPSFEDIYFSVRYGESLWQPGGEFGSLIYQPTTGCRLIAGKARPEPDAAWRAAANERKIGGNIFTDSRYSLQDEQKMRVLTLEDPGERYGARREAGGPVDFTVIYESALSGQALLECTRAVDKVAASFRLRNASENILLIEPRAPAKARAGEKLAVRGAARALAGVVHLTLVNESGAKLASQFMPVERSGGAALGFFQQEIIIPKTAENRLQLRVFQFSPTDGSIVDLVELPLTIE